MVHSYYDSLFPHVSSILAVMLISLPYTDDIGTCKLIHTDNNSVIMLTHQKMPTHYTTL